MKYLLWAQLGTNKIMTLSAVHYRRSTDCNGGADQPRQVECDSFLSFATWTESNRNILTFPDGIGCVNGQREMLVNWTQHLDEATANRGHQARRVLIDSVNNGPNNIFTGENAIKSEYLTHGEF